jgi:hypothetical protein
MTARRIFGPTRIETTGASAIQKLDPISGYGEVKDVEYMLKVHKVKTTATTTVTVEVKHSPDGDASLGTALSTPINASVVGSEPILKTGDTDSATNGPLGEFLHVGVGVGGGAGEWAVVELYEVKKYT